MTTEQDLQRLDIRRGPSREDSGRGGLPIGYQDENGTAVRPVRGDQAFPFFKDPPDLTPTVVWRQATNAQDAPSSDPVPNVLPAAPTPKALELLEEVVVTGYRTLNLAVEFYAIDPVAAEQQLYLMLSAGFDLPQNAYRLDAAGETVRRVWAPIGVVDPTLRGMDAAPFSLDPPCVAFRNAYASQFNVRATAVAAFDPTSPCALTLVFDVAPYDVVRLGLGASNETSTAGVLYTLGR